MFENLMCWLSHFINVTLSKNEKCNPTYFIALDNTYLDVNMAIVDLFLHKKSHPRSFQGAPLTGLRTPDRSVYRI